METKDSRNENKKGHQNSKLECLMEQQEQSCAALSDANEPLSLGNRYQRHLDVTMEQIRAFVIRALVIAFWEKAHR